METSQPHSGAVAIAPEQELAHLHLMQAAVEHASDYVLIVDWTGPPDSERIVYVNASFSRITGFSREEALGRNPKTLLCGPSTDRAFLRRMLTRVNGGTPVTFELLHYCKGGSTLWLELSIFPLPGLNGKVTHSITFGRDVAERKLAAAALIRATVAEERYAALARETAECQRAKEQLAHVAYHDPLTGLPNRALFVDRVTSALARNGQHPEQFVAVLLLDCDRFKLVNETLGHLTGDLLLIAIARRLESCLLPGETLARIGGDEFTILLEHAQEAASAGDIAARLLKAFSTPFSLGEQEVHVTASIGIAWTSPSSTSAEDLMRDADIAMYRAKALGKDRCVAFTPQLRDRASRSLQVETALRRAIERRELRLAYQPIVSLADVRLVSFEALSRWKHPELGVVEPVEFIRVAEETGLIVALGDWVLNEACAQMRRWHDSFPNWHALSISVNVSAKQLQDEHFVTGVRETLARSGLSGEHLRIEITESVLMHDPVEAAAILRELRGMGIRLDMDDFGTGYSSLAYLHQFPLDALKIDRSFVSGLGSGVAYPEIVQTVIALARQLGLEVIAEGVESDEQERQLLALGCTYGQGYHFARPLDAPAATLYLEATQTLGGALATLRSAQPLAILPGTRRPRHPHAGRPLKRKP